MHALIAALAAQMGFGEPLILGIREIIGFQRQGNIRVHECVLCLCVSAFLIGLCRRRQVRQFSLSLEVRSSQRSVVCHTGEGWGV